MLYYILNATRAYVDPASCLQTEVCVVHQYNPHSCCYDNLPLPCPRWLRGPLIIPGPPGPPGPIPPGPGGPGSGPPCGGPPGGPIWGPPGPGGGILPLTSHPIGGRCPCGPQSLPSGGKLYIATTVTTVLVYDNLHKFPRLDSTCISTDLLNKSSNRNFRMQPTLENTWSYWGYQRHTAGVQYTKR